jgi:acyl carrier protein
MNLDQFIENFADLFDETDPDTIQASTRFKELEEWSSLLALSVIAMIDEEYDVEFRGDDIRGSNTVEDLYEIVETRVEELD